MSRKKVAQNFYDDIYITRHATNRFIQRNTKTMNGTYKGNVYRSIKGMIRKSTLISSSRQDNGDIYEYREYCGYIFVCSVSLNKNFWEKNKTTVITISLSEKKIQSLINKGFDMKDFDLSEETA